MVAFCIPHCALASTSPQTLRICFTLADAAAKNKVVEGTLILLEVDSCGVSFLRLFQCLFILTICRKLGSWGLLLRRW
jgi:hypothetical protein